MDREERVIPRQKEKIRREGAFADAKARVIDMGLTVCFTGHRAIPQEDRKWLAAATEKEIRRLIAAGADRFRAGGAYGFDTVAELKVLELRREFPGIRLELILPCRDQAAKWQLYDRLVYARILERADSAEYVSEEYTPSCMLARDRELIRGCDFCVAYQRNNTGGTAYTVRNAEAAGIPVIHLKADGLDKKSGT